MTRELDTDILTDPINAALITALWYSSVPLSATRYVNDYTEHVESAALTEVVGAHLETLDAAGVVTVDRIADGESSYVLGGQNSSEAVRRLRLGGTGR